MAATRPKVRLLVGILYGLAFGALFLVLAFTWVSSSQTAALGARMGLASRSVQIIDETNDLVEASENAQRGFLLSGDTKYLDSFDISSAEFIVKIDQLRVYTNQLPDVAQSVEHVRELGVLAMGAMKSVIDIYRTKGLPAAQEIMAKDAKQPLMHDIRSGLASLKGKMDGYRIRLNVENEDERQSYGIWLMICRVSAFIGILAVAITLSRDGKLRAKTQASLESAVALQSTILNSVGNAIIATDADGTITQFNRTAEAWLGYQSDEVVGKLNPGAFHDPAEVVRSASDLGIDQPLSEAVGFQTIVRSTQENLFREGEWTYVRKDGTTFPAVLTVNAVKDHSEAVVGYVGLIRDLTEHNQTQMKMAAYVEEIKAANALTQQQNRELIATTEELKQSRDAAVTATRLKSEFLANMSHEIRTPMNGVIGMVHLLLSTPLTEKQQGYARTVRQSADSLLAILNDILDLSKMEAGKMTLESFPFDLRQMLEEICDVLAPSAHVKGLELNSVFAPSVSTRVIGDPGRLRQILTNLMGNSIKFTEKGEVNISVKVLKENKKQVRYLIVVKDTGIGIAPDRQERIFDSFTQADGTTTRKFGGTGLGLTICKQLVELMGGDIGVTSVVGSGSEFWLQLAFEKQSSADSPADTLDQNLAGIRVLVADDNATNRQILREMLTTWNCRVEEALSGSDALSVIRLSGNDPFDAAILDYQMPGMDGFQSAKAIKKDSRFRNLPLILLSPSGFIPPNAESSKMFGAVLTKPVKNSPLFNALSQLTGIHGRYEPNRSEPTVEMNDALKGVRVLVVEDNAVNQLVVNELLEGWGCIVQCAGNGRLAVEATSENNFEAILMDVQMPVMDGFEATAEIRRQEETSGIHTPIIAMTANAMSGDRERCLKAGMDSYLSKPLQPSLLFEKLAEAAGKVLAIQPVQTDPVEATNEGVLNLARLDESCGGNKGLKLKVLEKYLTTSLDSLALIAQGVSLGDAKTTKSAAHALKGSSFTVGLEQIGTRCEEVELVAGRSTFGPQYTDVANSLREELIQAHAAIRSHIDLIKMEAE